MRLQGKRCHLVHQMQRAKGIVASLGASQRWYETNTGAEVPHTNGIGCSIRPHGTKASASNMETLLGYYRGKQQTIREGWGRAVYRRQIFRRRKLGIKEVIPTHKFFLDFGLQEYCVLTRFDMLCLHLKENTEILFEYFLIMVASLLSPDLLNDTPLARCYKKSAKSTFRLTQKDLLRYRNLE